MTNSRVIREEPGEYRVTMEYALDGTFEVAGESKAPITLTVRWKMHGINFQSGYGGIHMMQKYGATRWKSQRTP